MEPKRYTSPIKYLHWLSDTISVVCPNCSKKAELISTKNQDCKFECKHCFVSIKRVDLFEYEVKRNCPYCGTQIQYNSQLTTKIKKDIEVSCSSCKITLCYTPRVSKSRNFWNDGECIEFDYWYQTNFKSNNLWAINLKHIQFLEDYVSATLRERYIHKYGMMLAERLPQFIKSKKNRTALLKALQKLKEK